MIEIRINKEIGNYEPKFVGPFTMRQTVCIVAAAPLCYFIYKYASPHITADLAGFLCAIPGGIAALFGWVKPYGMKMERFIQSVFITTILAPAYRKYKTKNVHDQILTRLIDGYEELQQSQSNNKKKSWLPEKKVKYKISPEAVE